MQRLHADASLLHQPWGHREWPLILSTPERAILELLDEVPQRETFHQADMLMEGLPNLSPRRLQILLTGCRSIKVKRLDRRRIDLGHGKRMLVRDGRLDTRFNITVPKNFDAAV